MYPVRIASSLVGVLHSACFRACLFELRAPESIKLSDARAGGGNSEAKPRAGGLLSQCVPAAAARRDAGESGPLPHKRPSCTHHQGKWLFAWSDLVAVIHGCFLECHNRMATPSQTAFMQPLSRQGLLHSQTLWQYSV